MTPPTATLADHVKQAKHSMDKAVEAVKREFSTVRTGKATTSLLDLVRVEAYGSEMPLNQVASVAAPEPKLLTIQPWDKALLRRSKRRSSRPIWDSPPPTTATSSVSRSPRSTKSGGGSW